MYLYHTDSWCTFFFFSHKKERNQEKPTLQHFMELFKTEHTSKGIHLSLPADICICIDHKLYPTLTSMCYNQNNFRSLTWWYQTKVLTAEVQCVTEAGLQLLKNGLWVSASTVNNWEKIYRKVKKLLVGNRT